MPLIKYYDPYDEKYFWDALDNGITILTSGTSGVPKEIYNHSSKIYNDAKNAIEVQEITSDSKIYTCLNPTRAGGLFAQTIPGLIAGADVVLERFSPYQYVRVAENFTHTHLTPKQAKAVMKTKGFKKLDLTDKIFLVGSEPVTYDIIEAFVERGAKVILIWGMSEIGVNAILHVFNNMDDVNKWKSVTPAGSTVIGNIRYCDCKIIDDVLYVSGDICVYPEWYNTKDKVILKDDCLYYTGRTNAEVDFDNPRKG